MFLIYLLILSQTNTASFMEKKRFQQEFYCHIESSFFLPSFSLSLLRYFSISCWNGIFSICDSSVLLIRLSALQWVLEGACIDCELLWSCLNSYRCYCNVGTDILSWGKMEGIKACLWKCRSYITVLLCMFLLPFFLSTDIKKDCTWLWDLPQQQPFFLLKTPTLYFARA